MLTIDSAKAYVNAYYAECDGVYSYQIGDAFASELDGIPSVMVTASVVFTHHAGPLHFDHWDVWVEGGALYGEC